MEQLTKIDDKLRLSDFNAYDGIALFALGTMTPVG